MRRKIGPPRWPVFLMVWETHHGQDVGVTLCWENVGSRVKRVQKGDGEAELFHKISSLHDVAQFAVPHQGHHLRAISRTGFDLCSAIQYSGVFCHYATTSRIDVLFGDVVASDWETWRSLEGQMGQTEVCTVNVQAKSKSRLSLLRTTKVGIINGDRASFVILANQNIYSLSVRRCPFQKKDRPGKEIQGHMSKEESKLVFLRFAPHHRFLSGADRGHA